MTASKAGEEYSAWRLTYKKGGVVMGKGDLRTKRGKIFRGTFGKYRLKNSKKEKIEPQVAEETPETTPVEESSDEE